MKTILFPSTVALDDLNDSSGSTISIYKSLKKHFNVIMVGPLQIKKPVVQRGLNFLYKKNIFPYKYATVHNWKTVNSYAKQLQKFINNIDIDGIFVYNSFFAAKLNTDKPIFAYSDFSYFSAIDYYPFATKLAPSSQKEALEIEKLSYENCTKVFLASNWSKQKTSEAYNLNEDKIIAIKRGANLESGFSNEQIEKLIEKRISSNKKKFLFVGVDWERKGGDIAFDLVTRIREMGYDIYLQIVGCNPPNNIKEMPFVQVYPFLNRQNKEDLQILNNLFSEAFCFILPTRAEAMGIVFAEAASFGLPTISFDTGGVSEAIENDKTGILFNFSDTSQVMVEKLLPLLYNRDVYQAMSKRSFEKYKDELNWNSIAYKIKEIITPYL